MISKGYLFFFQGAMQMNKLMGFFELREMNLPCVPWKEYHTGDTLDDRFFGPYVVQYFVGMALTFRD